MVMFIYQVPVAGVSNFPCLSASFCIIQAFTSQLSPVFSHSIDPFPLCSSRDPLSFIIHSYLHLFLSLILIISEYYVSPLQAPHSSLLCCHTPTRTRTHFVFHYSMHNCIYCAAFHIPVFDAYDKLEG